MIFQFLKPIGVDLTRFDAGVSEVLVPYVLLHLCLKAAMDRWGNPVTRDRPAGFKATFQFFHHVYNFAMALFACFFTGMALYAVVWETVLNSGKGPANLQALFGGGNLYSNAHFSDAVRQFADSTKWACFVEAFFFLMLSGGDINDVSLLSHFRTLAGTIAYGAAFSAKSEFMWAIVLIAGCQRFLAYADRAAAASAGQGGIRGLLRIPDAVPLGQCQKFFMDGGRNELLLNAAQAGVMFAFRAAGGDAWLSVMSLVGVNLFLSLDREFAVWNKGTGSGKSR